MPEQPGHWRRIAAFISDIDMIAAPGVIRCKHRDGSPYPLKKSVTGLPDG
jgi:hypothetical protein